MDKDYWLNFYFREDEKPNLYCSKCKTGRLFIKDKFILHETFLSQKMAFDELYYSDSDREFKFVGFLECNNYLCRELYTISGIVYREPDEPVFDESGEILGQDLFYLYKPEFISPPLEIIELKKEYPRTVNDALYESFKLFFADNEACANKIRTVVELLLDDRDIENKKGIRLNDRIIKFKAIDPTNGGLLEAVKWIGNYGSHQDKIVRQDVLDGYELLKAVLDDLYDNESEKLRLKAERINTNKKPISKIK